jgi:tRNA-modifying protein YgfZ
MTMNTAWETFLVNQQGVIDEQGGVTFPQGDNFADRVIYPLTCFGVLTVSGKDAAQLLQGQITCNVYDITPSKSSLAAMCNPKGRAIAVFLLVKNADDFLLIMPTGLLATVRNKLQMYVLRSQVTITDSSEAYGILGVLNLDADSQPFFTETNDGVIAVAMPYVVSRKLLIAPVANALELWAAAIEQQGFSLGSTTRWKCLDIYSGIPWLTLETSEEYIPQMLNLDKLGGISFTKGCYTGQEIIARTHYLGKAKRELFLAECDVTDLPLANAAIVDESGQNAVGNVLAAEFDQTGCKILAVLPKSENEDQNLSLRDYNQSLIHLLPFNV